MAQKRLRRITPRKGNSGASKPRIRKSSIALRRLRATFLNDRTIDDRPTVCTLWIASWKASAVWGQLLLPSPSLPFQSGHMLGALTAWLMAIGVVWGSVASVTLIGFDHQNCV